MKRDLAVAYGEYLGWERAQRRAGSGRRATHSSSSRCRSATSLPASFAWSRIWRRRYGDGTMRVTADQDLLLRWIRVADLEGASRPAGGGRARSGRRTVGRERHELSGGRVLQARGDAIARTRPAVERCVARAPGSRGGRARPRDQDERLSERMRTASHRGHRLPGQHPEARRPCRSRSTSSTSAAVRRLTALSSGGWRRKFLPVARRRRRTPDRAVSAASGRTRVAMAFFQRAALDGSQGGVGRSGTAERSRRDA